MGRPGVCFVRVNGFRGNKASLLSKSCVKCGRMRCASLHRHEAALATNPRTALMAKNVARLSVGQRLRIRDDAQRVLQDLEVL